MAITNKIKYILIAIAITIAVIGFFLLGYNCYPILNKHVEKTTTDKHTEGNSAAPTVISESSQVSLVPKTHEEDPDVIVNRQFTAEVNGETVSIPHQSTKFPKGTQSVIKTDIDLTPVVKKLADSEYKRNWEVGVGVGVSHDRDFYVPLSVQRNYNYDRALEFQIGVTKDHIENVQVTHKWKF